MFCEATEEICELLSSAIALTVIFSKSIAQTAPILKINMTTTIKIKYFTYGLMITTYLINIKL